MHKMEFQSYILSLAKSGLDKSSPFSSFDTKSEVHSKPDQGVCASENISQTRMPYEYTSLFSENSSLAKPSGATHLHGKTCDMLTNLIYPSNSNL